MRVELNVDNLLMLRAGDSDGGGKSDSYRGVNGGEHGAMAHGWGFTKEMAKLVIYEEVFIRRCDMT